MTPATAANMAMITKMTARTTAPVRRPPDVPTELIMPSSAEPFLRAAGYSAAAGYGGARAVSATKGLAFCWSSVIKGLR
jgi:hypothetical protein